MIRIFTASDITEKLTAWLTCCEYKHLEEIHNQIFADKCEWDQDYGAFVFGRTDETPSV